MQSIKTVVTPACGERVFSSLLALLTLGAVLLASAPSAQAQVSKVLPIRLKLGVLLPSDRETKNYYSGTHFSGEVDIAVPFASGGGQSSLVSVGYSRGSRDGHNYQVIPVMLTKVSSPGNPASRVTGNIYYGLGLGLYFVRASGISVSKSSGAFLEIGSKSRTLFGTSLVLGYQTPLSFFIEGKYHLATGSVEGYSPNGLSLFIGKRL